MKKKICSIQIQTFQPRIFNQVINTLKIFEKLNNNLFITYKTLPIQIKKFTVQRSPHVFKKTREQFELRTYTYLISIDSVIHSRTTVQMDFQDLVNQILFILTEIEGIVIKMKRNIHLNSK